MWVCTMLLTFEFLHKFVCLSEFCHQWNFQGSWPDSVASLLLLFSFSSTFKCMHGPLIPYQNNVFLEMLLAGLLILLPILSTSQAFYHISAPLGWPAIVVFLLCASEQVLCVVNSAWAMFQPIIWHQSGKQLRFNQSLVTQTLKQHVGLSLVL